MRIIILKRRRMHLSIFTCILFLCASLGIPNSASFASLARDESAYTTNVFSGRSSFASTALPSFSQEWQVLISKIDQARDRGELTIDAAARLRFTALTAPDSLPAEFQLTLEELEDILDASADEGQPLQACHCEG